MNKIDNVLPALLNKHAIKQLETGFKLTGIHLYENLNRDLLYFRARLKHPSGKKWIRPFHFDPNKNEWVMKEPIFTTGKPLYRLPDLASLSDEPYFIMEGEPKVDALIKLGLYSTTSGSCTSASNTDWDILQNKNIVIWQDKNKEGLQYAQEVTKILLNLGCIVQWIDVSTLDIPDGGDVIDWLAKNPSAKKNDILNLSLMSPVLEDDIQENILKNSLNYRNAAEIQIKPINWLWNMRLAKGKISIISGDPGVGKSQLLANMASIISRGDSWPDQTQSDQGKVIFLSAEDSAEDTIVPRLTAAGANLHEIFIIDSMKVVDDTGNSTEQLFDLNADLLYLKEMLSKLPGVSAIFIDPITAYIGNVDDSKNSRIRAVLAPLTKLAEEHNIAIICISHNNKNDQYNAIYRIAGSIGYVAAARAAYVVLKDKNSDTTRLFLPLKNNLGNDKTGLSYRVEECDLGNGIISSKIVWESSCVAISAQEALSPTNQDEKFAVNEAEDFLLEFLEDGQKESKLVYEEAKNTNISEQAIKRAQHKLGIKPKKLKGVKNGPWFWELPTIKHGGPKS